MSFAAFILSTGRCGTQWIAAALSNLYSDCITVEHEPLQNRYDARKTLESFNANKFLNSLSSEVLCHMKSIEKRIATQPYIECGHPSWSTIPYLAERFDSLIRIIHLTRHPVPTCCSWLTHSAFRNRYYHTLQKKFSYHRLIMEQNLKSIVKCGIKLFRLRSVYSIGVRCMHLPWNSRRV